jgi:hypothetical protein
MRERTRYGFREKDKEKYIVPKCKRGCISGRVEKERKK